MEDFDRNVYNNIPTLWERELLHEMLHEYQYKILVEPSQEGIDLFNNYQVDERTARLHNGTSGFGGPGHNELFYTAIAIFYHNYANTVSEFINMYI